jgi:hypothetical protein
MSITESLRNQKLGWLIDQLRPFIPQEFFGFGVYEDNLALLIDDHNSIRRGFYQRGKCGDTQSRASVGHGASLFL